LGAVLSIVVPCYNEQDRLPATVDAIKSYMSEHGIDYELILSDDGSADHTRDVIARAIDGTSNVHGVTLPRNRGKGRALAEGVAVSKGDRVLLTDADLSTPIEELPKLEARLDAGAGVAIASRSIKGAQVVVSQPIYRVLMGKTFNIIVQALLLPGLWDTQCGFKLFRGDLARSVFADLKTDGFGYDPEVLYLAKRRGEKIAEVQVVWRNSAPTKVAAIRHSLDMFGDVVRTRFRRIDAAR
jgi:dolichyl-phosphate beta-glucosyltransferase